MKWLLLILLIGFPATSWAQVVDIVGVRDNFIVAGIAAQKCNASDRQRQDTHDRNFTIISRKAMEVIIARATGAGGNAEEARSQDLAHIEKLQDAAFNLIRSEGCKSDKVRALLRLHRMHETIRF